MDLGVIMAKQQQLGTLGKSTRDDFSQQDKERLGKRVGFHCSNPDCGIVTIGSSSESNSSVNNIGVAAHIFAAASGKGARRYKASMTSEERKSIENGIWLCYNCSVKIDKDEIKYTEKLLQEWKCEAEEKARERFGNKLYSKEEIAAIVNNYNKQHQFDAEQIKSLTIAITALVQGQTHATKSEVDAAFTALRNGDLSLALSLFEKEDSIRDEEANDKLRAEIKRNIGALAFYNDTEKSRKAYLRATQLDPDNADGWNRLGLLLKRIGEIDKALSAYQTTLCLGQKNKDQRAIAAAYSNIGNIYYIIGNLDKANEYHNKSLKIHEILGENEGIAENYGNLGNTYYTLGDLDKADEYYKNSLRINTIIKHKKGMASDYGSLGNVYLIQGYLHKAIEYYNKALEIEENIGCKENIAISYGNLGVVYKQCGYLDKAIEYYNKALEINESLGCKEGMAIQYGNLGIVYEKCGYLDKAIAYYNKALEINESLGRKEGMAGNYSNLGLLYVTNNDYGRAWEFWQKSLLLYQSLGSPHTKTVQGWLDALPE
jgi:tetratricopeptide (TPR) repeat protein